MTPTWGEVSADLSASGDEAILVGVRGSEIACCPFASLRASARNE